MLHDPTPEPPGIAVICPGCGEDSLTTREDGLSRCDLCRYEEKDLGSVRESASADAPVCDFCSAKPVVWRFHATTFEMGRAKDPETGHLLRHMSRGDWAACEACKKSLNNGLVAETSLRYVENHKYEIPEFLHGLIRMQVRQQHQKFLLAKKGPGEPAPSTWEETT